MSILPPHNSYSSFLLSFFTRLCNPCLSHNAIDLDLDLKQEKEEKEEKEEKMPGLVANSEAAVNPPPTAHVAASKPTPPPGKTFAYQDRLPHLPIPPLEDTCKRYLKALEALQDEYEHEETKKAVKDFLENDGPRIQQKLIEWGKRKDRCVWTHTRSVSRLTRPQHIHSYIEDFWYESYLSHSDPVVLALNPFFVLECVPTPCRQVLILTAVQKRPHS
jgi:carnitine O-acetyltransferase